MIIQNQQQRLRQIGKSINHVAKKNGIKVSWRAKGDTLTITVEDANLIKMHAIVDMMGFDPERGNLRLIGIKG
jgi:hypothetical protein